MKKKNIYFNHTQYIRLWYLFNPVGQIFYPQNNFNLFIIIINIFIYSFVLFVFNLFAYLFIYFSIYLFTYLFFLFFNDKKT